MRMHRNILRKITAEGLDPNVEYIEDSLGNLVPKVQESIPTIEDNASLNVSSDPIDEKEGSEILVEKPKRKPPPPRKKKIEPTVVQE